MAQKFKIERIESAFPEYAEAARILRVLEDGERRIQLDIDILNTESALERRPNDKRAIASRDRLRRERGSAEAPKSGPSPSTELAPIVAEALKLLDSGARPPNRRVERRAILERLEGDLDIVRRAKMEQSERAEASKSRCEAERLPRLRAENDAKSLAIFRALQIAAAAANDQSEFRKAVTDAGYRWREDLLPTPLIRSVLVLGREADWDSEISRVRRQLEEMKIL